MDKIFRGWIPNVTGALSFSSFGEVSHPPRSVTANRGDASSRFIISYQMRDQSDVQIPLKRMLAPKLFRTQGRIWFVCIAESEPKAPAAQNSLRGRALLFGNDEVWKNTVKPLIEQAQRKLQTFSFSRSEESIDGYFKSTYETLKYEIEKHSIFNCNFLLNRSGIIDIIIPNDIKTIQNAPKFPEVEPQRSYYYDLLTSQIYFFLRDIGHRHQHHDPYTDTIVNVYQIQNKKDDILWRRQTLFGLYRHIIRFKRKYDADVFYNALGVLAYAKAFRKIGENELKQYSDELPIYYPEELEMSIQAVHSRVLVENERSSRRREIVRNLLISIIGLVLSLIGILQITDFKIDNPHYVLKLLAGMLILQPVNTVFCIILSIFAILIINGEIDVKKLPAVVWLFRIMQPFHFCITMALLILGAMTSAVLALLLI